MRRARSNWSRPPQPLRRTLSQLDNLVLVPASEIASLKTWQRQAQYLPPGNTLLVLPSDNLKLREVGRRISLLLKQQGRQSRIATVPPKAIHSQKNRNCNG